MSEVPLVQDRTAHNSAQNSPLTWRYLIEEDDSDRIESLAQDRQLANLPMAEHHPSRIRLLHRGPPTGLTLPLLPTRNPPPLHMPTDDPATQLDNPRIQLIHERTVVPHPG